MKGTVKWDNPFDTVIDFMSNIKNFYQSLLKFNQGLYEKSMNLTQML